MHGMCGGRTRIGRCVGFVSGWVEGWVELSGCCEGIATTVNCCVWFHL
jgi:hypothetical protein